MIRALYALAGTVILTVSLSTGLKIADALQTQPSPAGTATSTAPAPVQSPTAFLSPSNSPDVLLPSEQPTEAPTPSPAPTAALPTAAPSPLQSQQPIPTPLPTQPPTPLPTLVPTPLPTPLPTPAVTPCAGSPGNPDQCPPKGPPSPLPTPPQQPKLEPLFLPLLAEDDGCRPEPITPNTPTGIAGCWREGLGTASFYTASGTGAAMNYCTWTLRHTEGCGSVKVTALSTGISVRIPIVDFCDCYTGTAQERIIDLQGGVLPLLGLNPAEGLWRVETQRVTKR